MNDFTPKERVFKSLEYIAEILDSGENLEARRYEITRNIKNALSWESELINNSAENREAS
ncbi:hypothetical protein KDX38_10865 [Pseudomonas sp. CDFA 602]|uniref:hypothetical protein n=1 Tax=Pseudomonas californiensis TaxID=2829823 RepID=UPI001E58780E|nr:hypothetical protein [Pseudomonas californiensis]MCD5994182.1 hypothetical protein [Pseudomonas californiensis]MCD5999719.1 hypothetical protein [Pseudomonas californiensis]